MYPHGRKDRVFRFHANGSGLLSGGVRLPIESIPSWEWLRRIRVPSLYLLSTQNQDVYDWMSHRIELLRRIFDRTWRFSHLVQVDCGELNVEFATLFGFSTWFCRTAGDRSYFQRLRNLLATPPEIAAGFGITTALMGLGQKVPSGFLFLPHGRGGGDLESHGGAHTL